MDTIKLEGIALEDNATTTGREQEPPARELRTLAELELALVSGGEGLPCWP